MVATVFFADSSGGCAAASALAVAGFAAGVVAELLATAGVVAFAVANLAAAAFLFPASFVAASTGAVGTTVIVAGAVPSGLSPYTSTTRRSGLASSKTE